MLNIKTLSILAIAGSAAAAPQWGGWAGKYFGGSQNSDADQGAVVTDIEYVTAYTTVTGHWGGGNWGGSPPAASSTATPEAAFTPPPQAPAPSAPAPSAPAPSASPSMQSWSAVPSAVPSAAPVSGNGGSGYMGIVNEWRGKLGMSSLTESDQLQANALKTVTDSNGQMVHELNPGSFAQVLAPGNADDFEKVFVGGWLCERPDLPGLDGICATMSQGWSYDGQTGHADILTSKAYSKIGCALYAGIWGCDLA